MNDNTSFLASSNEAITASAALDVFSGTSTAPTIVILMAVKDGARNLRDQLESIAAQSHQNWQLLISDDGSTDGSDQIIEEFSQQGHQVKLLNGPRQGAAANFMSLIRALPEHAPQGCWLAFADQDDVWLPEKLTLGIASIQAKPSPIHPTLYCSRSWITAADLSGWKLSMPRPRPPGFRNALIQNIAAGNTILLNSAGTRLVTSASREVDQVVMHDWWTYQIMAGAGGDIVHDDTPTLLYRQHGANHVGANNSISAKGRRFFMLLGGRFRIWNDVNIQALQQSSAHLTATNQALLDTFTDMRSSPLPTRLRVLRRLGLYRQNRASTLSLWLAAILRKL